MEVGFANGRDRVLVDDDFGITDDEWPDVEDWLVVDGKHERIHFNCRHIVSVRLVDEVNAA